MTGPKKRSTSTGTKHPTNILEGDSEADSGFVTPDSTTGGGGGNIITAPIISGQGGKQRGIQGLRHDFRVGDEVLSHGKDGRFYFGNIVEIDDVSWQCLVQFADNTAHWSLFKDLRNLKVPESDELCAICKSSKTTDTNEIVLCHHCQQGYHQNCLQPRISPCYTEANSKWECPQCSDPQPHSTEKQTTASSGVAKRTSSIASVVTTLEAPSPRKTRAHRSSHTPTQHDEVDNKQKLPYLLSSLHWDSGHKMNNEQTYCYCGGPGEWYNRMLQCNRCRQWFHEACLDSLHYPLLYGDRFYVFVCNLCNESCGELVYRMPLRWVDAVHLAVFNLTLHDVKTYFDYEAVITHWINNNWELLQAPLEMQNVCVDDRKIEVLRVLESNRPRFKCGREVRKRACVWGLRSRVPPPVPSLYLPPGPVTEEIILEHTTTTDVLGNSPPIPRSFRLRDDKSDDPLQCGGGSSHHSPAKKRALTPTPSPSTSLLHHLNAQLAAAAAAVADTSCNGGLMVHGSSANSHNINNNNNNNSNNNNTASSSKAKRQPNHGEGPGRRKRKGELDKLMEDKKAKKMIEEVSCELSKLVPRLCQQTSAISRTTLAGGCIEVEESRPTKRKRGRPPKPADPKLGDSSQSRDASVKDRLSFPASSSSSCSLATEAADTSGDDTSSHGTLESFIPPPSNFDGHNNPFLHLDLFTGSAVNTAAAAVPVVNNAATSAAALPNNCGTTAASAAANTSQPFKRKLSENDLRIGKNGEIKRRKLRRRKVGSLHESSTNGCVVSPHYTANGSNDAANQLSGDSSLGGGDGNIKNCLDYALSARLMGSKGEGGGEGGHSMACGGGRMTSSSRVSFSDLKSTVNNYFGAANRIANGEKFHVLAKRMCMAKVQYLIEWESPNSS